MKENVDWLNDIMPDFKDYILTNNLTKYLIW
jgi:hypothetical protein